MNQVILVGKLAEQLQTDESGLKTIMKLEISRDDDNSVNRESVIIPVIIWRGLGEILQEKSQIGDLFAVRGSLKYSSSDLTVAAERVSLIKEK